MDARCPMSGMTEGRRASARVRLGSDPSRSPCPERSRMDQDDNARKDGDAKMDSRLLTSGMTTWEGIRWPSVVSLGAQILRRSSG